MTSHTEAKDGLTRHAEVHARRPARTIRSRAAIGLATLLAATTILSGCSLFGEPAPAAKEGDTSLTIQVLNPPQLDPQTTGQGMWIAQMGLLEGLVVQNDEGTDVEPAAAETWEVSDDQLTYTFTLRDDVRWSNGDQLVAGDFVWSYERLLDPDRGSSGATSGTTSYQSTLGIAKATQFNSGVVTDFSEVGVKALDDKTLEFTLNSPNPGFLLGLTFPSMLPLNPTAVQAESASWQEPENWVGNGPYIPVRWTKNSSMVLQKNENYWDADNVAVDTINFDLIEQGALQTTVEFEAGQVDIQPIGNPGDVSRFLADPVLGPTINRLDDLVSTYMVRLSSTNPILEDPDVFQALRLSLGREEMAGISDTAKPASTLVTRAVPGWVESIQRDPDMWGEDAVAEAQELLADAGYPGGKGFPELTILAPSDFPEIDVAIDTWQRNLGITVKKDVVESGVWVTKRAELHGDDYVGFWWGSFSGLFTWPYQTEFLWSPTNVKLWSLTGAEYGEYLAIQKNPDADAGTQSRRLTEYLDGHASPEALEFASLVADARDAVGDLQQELYIEAATARERADGAMPVITNAGIIASQTTVGGLNMRAQGERYYLKDLFVLAD